MIIVFINIHYLDFGQSEVEKVQCVIVACYFNIMTIHALFLITFMIDEKSLQSA